MSEMPKELKESFVKAITEGLVKKISGVKENIKRRLDYLMKPEVLETSSLLTSSQLRAINDCCWLGETFPSMKPLQKWARGLAQWSISKEGKGREQAVNTMMTFERKGALEGLGIYVRGAEAEAKEKGKGKK